MHLRVLVLLFAAAVTLLGGCDRRETPLAGKARGLGNSKGECTLEIEIPTEANVPTVHAAAAAWTAAGAPSVRLVTVPRTTPFEDGRSQLTLGVPGAHCREVAPAGGSAACLATGQEGVARHRASQDGVITEVDLVLDRALLDRPSRLYEVWLHELGHALGLDHFPGPGAAAPPAVSVMTNPAPAGASRPGAADVRSLHRAYGGGCR